jgi:hypothetical protein
MEWLPTSSKPQTKVPDSRKGEICNVAEYLQREKVQLTEDFEAVAVLVTA